MKKAIYLLTVLFLGFSFSPGKRGSFFSKIFELQFQYLVIICSLSLTEELETLFVDDAGEIYYIDGFYVDVLAKYEVNVKDPFGEGVAGVEVDWEMNYKKQIAEGTP